MKKNVIITLLVAVSLVVALFTVILVGGQSVEYDPWIDVNDDGKIDMKDIGQVARAFGATGTAINKTALLLELQDGLAELNATVISMLENQTSGILNIISDSYSGTTHATAGTLVVNFPASSFAQAPEIIYSRVVLKAAAAGMPKGAVVYANILSITKDNFEVEVVEHRGSYTTVNGIDVDVVYLAIGTSASNGHDCIVVTGSKPYNEPTAYVSGTGFVINVSDSIPSGFTLVSAFATGRKTDLGGNTLEEPPLNLLPTVNGINIEIRVWDAGGTEYDNWSNQRANIDYTLFITK